MNTGYQDSKLNIDVAYKLSSKVFRWLSPAGPWILAHCIDNERLFLDIQSGREFSAPFDCRHEVYEHKGRYLVFNAYDDSTFFDLNTGMGLFA
jgi:hypothetical protein